jgi:DNA-binding HxlR family transcriptional regulator
MYKPFASTGIQDTAPLKEKRDMAKKYLFCPVEITLDVIAGRWKVMIIYYLLEGKKRFNQLQRELRGISHRTLAKQLREMESQGIVIREDYGEIPPRVEYSLSPLGLSLKDILLEMHAWGEKYGSRMQLGATGTGSEEGSSSK